jgi:hypothetical protein
MNTALSGSGLPRQIKPVDETILDPRATGTAIAVLASQLRLSRVGDSAAYRPGPTHWPPLRYQRLAGLWPALQRCYIHPRPQSWFLSALSRLFEKHDACPDDNFYSNAWIFQNILETQSLRARPEFQDDALHRSALVLNHCFRDPQRPMSALRYFWPTRAPLDASSMTMAAVPTNLAAKVGACVRWNKALISLAAQLGLRGRAINRELTRIKQRLESVCWLKLPEDFDDSSLAVWISLYLAKHSDRYPKCSQVWATSVPDFVGALTRCAYRPFSEDRSESTIDPRTYYWIRHFLKRVADEAALAGHAPRLVLPTAWAQTRREAMLAAGRGGNVLPYYVNNIDVSVCANVLYALCAAIDGPVCSSWFAEDVQRLFHDTARLVAWVIEEKVVNERPDLTLLYYPNVGTFYWFVARVLRLLRTMRAESIAAFPVLARVRDGLEHAMHKATRVLVEDAVIDDSGAASWNGLFEERDRLYVTAATLNALYDTWTTQDDQGRLLLLPDTPVDVKQLLPQACRFLQKHAVSGQYPLENAFFSACVKSDNTYMHSYPANSITFADGTEIDPLRTRLSDLPSGSWSIGMTGVVSQEDYQALIECNRFGLIGDTQRQPYSNFAYWSVPDVTRSVLMLALTKSQRLATRAARHDLPETQRRPFARPLPQPA